MRVLLQIAGALVLAYAAYLLLLYVGQRSMMFPGAGMAARQNAFQLPHGAEAISIPASFGTVSAILLRAPDAKPAPALLYFHGNAEFAAQNTALLQPLTALPLHVLIVEYPGYAGSDGVTGRDTLGEAALLAYDWLTRRPEVDRSRIVAMGRSIGAGPAVELAVARPVAALVLLSAFSSIDAFAHGMGAPAFLIRDRYDNRPVLRGYSRPLLLFHGRRDRIIPYAHSLALAQAAPDARMVTLECGHNDCPYFDPAFVGALEAFLRDAAILPPD
ncbi:MAG TPA: hypothetical protein VFG21_05085 [Xanthomonadaceae bacterium]|nr:hypothetical protein [Xanthomonadaceae bacterium]